jgi:hypothetical protein
LMETLQSCFPSRSSGPYHLKSSVFDCCGSGGLNNDVNLFHWFTFSILQFSIFQFTVVLVTVLLVTENSRKPNFRLLLDPLEAETSIGLGISSVGGSNWVTCLIILLPYLTVIKWCVGISFLWSKE